MPPVTLRLLHTADWQIGKQFGQFEREEAAFLADRRIETVAALGQLATERDADAVLVAGDVFDMQTVSTRTFHRLAEAMQTFAGPWVLLPGNHDAALGESVWQQWRRKVDLPENLHFALEPGVIDLPDAGLAVLCAPLTQRHVLNDLTAAFDTLETAPNRIRVGLAHGSVQGVMMEAAEAQNPIAPDRAQAARLDYLALGDWHGTLRIDERSWYSGTPEPDRFRDNAPGQVLEVEIEAAGATPRVTEHAVGHYRWVSRSFHLRVPEDLEALESAMADWDRRTVLRLELEGELDLAGHQRLARIREAIHARVHALRVKDEGLALLPSDADIADLHADGYVAEVIDELREEQAKDPVSREALKLLLRRLAAEQAEAGS